MVAEIGHDARRYAIVGAFETTRNLTLLNLADLPPVPSVLFCDASGCVDADDQISEDTYVRLRPETVQWVRITAKALIGPDRF